VTSTERELGEVVAAVYPPETPVAVALALGSASFLVTSAPLRRDLWFDCDTVGYAGSLAKQLTGACAALLESEGALDLESSLADWLPELPWWAVPVRVRHLIHHTAGLPTTDVVWARMQEAGELDWTSDGAIAALATLDEPRAEPGAGFSYSNVGYICLARVLERAGSLPLGELARQRLFHPLGMSSTVLWSGPESTPPGATAVNDFGPPFPLSLGDGGLWTTARDLLRWNTALVADVLGVSETLHAPGHLDDGTPLDYAWGVRVHRVGGDRIQSHGGSWDGATARAVRLPDRGASFAILTLDGSIERIMELSDRLQAMLLGRSPRGGEADTEH
jgi:CubicO group peptidase (beta-lactamase class C family)